jgi:hypothetical protein
MAESYVHIFELDVLKGNCFFVKLYFNEMTRGLKGKVCRKLYRILLEAGEGKLWKLQ